MHTAMKQLTQQILLPLSIWQDINREYSCGEKELRRALRYECNSNRAKELRRAALNRGGLVYRWKTAPKGYVPKVGTEHDEMSGAIRQKINERLELVFTRDGRFEIRVDSEPAYQGEGVTTREWGNMLLSLETIDRAVSAEQSRP